MQIIPVLDLMGDRAVHARGGARDRYRPLRTRLCDDPDPEAVAARLFELYPFPAVYLADLDALMQRGDNHRSISRLIGRYPDKTFWIDQGYPLAASAWFHYPNWMPVIGTESLSVESWETLKRGQQPYILSLDFTEAGLIGPSVVLEESADWPQTVIVMSLARVGSHHGPDLARLEYCRSLHPGAQWVAAGGLRDSRDLARLKESGIDAVLVASALHEGTIDREILSAWQH